MRILLFLGCVLFPLVGFTAEPAGLAKSVLFRASFDTSVNADAARGDSRLYTARSLQREGATPGIDDADVVWDPGAGRSGGALRFVRKSEKFIFYQGKGNLPYTKTDFQGTVSFWLRLTPDQDLPEGFVDPLQITDKKWNDASFFVDFTQEVPRTFRLGVFADYKSWNPTDRQWDEVPENERPLVNVAKPPFSRDKWTHVAFSFKHLNSSGKVGKSELYLDGKSQGRISKVQQLSWEPENVAIWLGINYVGLMDDLVVFDRALTAAEIRSLSQ